LFAQTMLGLFQRVSQDSLRSPQSTRSSPCSSFSN
jgi:hypothetical protein